MKLTPKDENYKDVMSAFLRGRASRLAPMPAKATALGQTWERHEERIDGVAAVVFISTGSESFLGNTYEDTSAGARAKTVAKAPKDKVKTEAKPEPVTPPATEKSE